MEQVGTSPGRATARRSSGPAVLVAAAMWPPGRECVPGELVWISDLCDDLPCQCEWGFNGVATDGIAMAAEVRRLPGVSRRSIRTAIAGVLRTHGYPPAIAAARVDALLDLAEAYREGTLLRLEHGVPVPFPPGSRVVDAGCIESPAPGGWR